ncbi:Gfo/Idh/MocA family oxidoreductase, partial [Pseudomonas aeruginosa]|nr:Gfo/Idh/MocA family oxidoreductase [Pseudomonas aeruginosa]
MTSTCSATCAGKCGRLLEEARPQAAIVANPNNLHVATALDCLAAGVPLLLEKPVGV